MTKKTTTTESLHGTVERVVYYDEASGFTIFILSTAKLSTVVRGTIPSLKQGISLEVQGSWTIHPKFGKQFLAESCIVNIPTSQEGLINYFGSGMVKGIGKVFGEKLVKTFGPELISIIEETPHRLGTVEGIGPKRIEQITSAWKEQREFGRILIFLREKQISPAYAMRIYKHYGNATISVIEENPYRLAEEVWGIGFLSADTLAQNMGIQKKDPRRIAAGLLHLFSNAASSGDLYIEESQIFQQITELLSLEQSISEIQNILRILIEQNKIVSLTHRQKKWLGLRKHLRIEQRIAEKIRIITNTAGTNRATEELAQELCTNKNNQLELHEQQIRGILTALAQKITIITGGPGTGKTTLIRILLSILDKKEISYKLTAPTGRAAKRMIESTGRFATTIHRLLEFDPQSMHFKHNAQNTLVADFFIIDEASMIDVFLANALLQAIPDKAVVVFIGDTDQLPSVGPGNFLRDLIESTYIPTIRLTEVFRQAKESLIILNAHRINHGEFPITRLEDMETKKDVLFIKESDAPNILPHIRRCIEYELPKRCFNKDDVQILCPMNRGIAGTQTINQYIQKLLFPQPRAQLFSFGTPFSEGDRVMQIRNNYDKKVFNGDIGTIQHINSSEKKLTVLFGPGSEVEYEEDELHELTLAYAVTIHKSQGSEYPVVIIPIFMQHFMLLQRNLLYTAFTRAQKLCILIGEPRAIAMALKKTESKTRATFLKDLLLDPELYHEQ